MQYRKQSRVTPVASEFVRRITKQGSAAEKTMNRRLSGTAIQILTMKDNKAETRGAQANTACFHTVSASM
jgi:hypothetical protein